jgi:TonB family protein
MNQPWVAFVSLSVLILGSAMADPPPARPNPSGIVAAPDRPFGPTAAADAIALAGFYPPEAKARGLAGQATISCHRAPHGSLVGCNIVSETPTGAGFGAAALAIAASKADRPTTNILPQLQSVPFDITFRFSPSPLSVGPDVLSPYWGQPTMIIETPRFTEIPSAVEMARHYPKSALRQRLGGNAVLHCEITLQGLLSDCRVLSENPPSLGFGDAALALAPNFRVAPRIVDGKSLSQGQITIPIRFIMP